MSPALVDGASKKWRRTMRKLIGGFLTTIFAVGMLHVTGYAVDNDNGWSDVCCEQEEGFFLQVEGLIWKACRTGLDYALGVNVCDGLQDGRVHVLSFDWHVGVRAVLGYRLDCDRWDMRVDYTRFHVEATGSVSDPSAGEPSLRPTRFHPFFGGGDKSAEKLSGKFDLGYDIVDVLLRHSFCPCPSFELRPYGGIRGLFVKEDLTIDVAGSNYISAAADRILWSNDHKAAGLRGGVEGFYHICGDFSFFGDFGGSIVVGKPETRYINNKSNVSYNLVDIFESRRCMVSCSYDAAAGIMWERCCGDTVVALSIGYELHKWNTMASQRRYFNPAHYGIGTDTALASLGFHGAFIRGRVDF